jgi:YVTN family beta-propeller protein
LTGGGAPTTGGITNDGASLYVGATATNDVQKIDTATGAVTAQIAVNLKKADGTATVPDLVIVKP